MTQQVVVTGIGAVTPLGHDRESSWRGLIGGHSGVGPITRFDPDGLPVRIAAEVTDFHPEDHLDAKQVSRSARISQFAVVAAREAVADAGLTVDAERAHRVGVVVNTAVAGMGEIEDNVDVLVNDGPTGVSPYFVSSVIPNMPACEVAMDLGAHGAVTASTLACASGVYALMEARRLIRSGEADVVIAGGADSSITPVMFAGLTNMGALSRRNDDPERASRPFDADRDGFVYGEGAVIFVVESAEHAAARGVGGYAEVAGAALTSDAFHVSAPEPTAEFATEAIRRALRDADLAPTDIDYVCAHGTSTKANDVLETRALRTSFGGHADSLSVSSPKSMVGHLLGAAGALSTMVCLLGIRDGVVPPTANVETPDPECDLDYVPKIARELRTRASIANAFGFGGQNCVAVFRPV